MPNHPNTTKSWLDNQELMIVKGVYSVPGDTNSVEPRIDSINLIDDKSGVALAPDGWTPQYPSLEGSGVWADTPLTVGRTPLVMTEGNVTEKMRLNVVAGSTHQMLAIRAKFSLFVRYARDFWTENYQIDPVYIHWFASCGGGRQYALIYNMELDWDDKESPTPTSVLTLTIEREPYWRWLPPGANPEQWYAEWNNIKYDWTKTFFPGSGLTASQSANNRSELAKSGSTYSIVSNNALTIPASQIPGDAPALVMLQLSNGSVNSQFIVGKKTTKIPSYSATSPAVLTIPQNTIFQANQGTLGTDATTAADTGAVLNYTGTARRVEISFATATNQLRWNIPGNEGRANRFIGRWMVFLRCRQSSGSVGDIRMYLRYGLSINSDSDGQKLNVVNPPVIAGTGNTTNWGWVYMGIIQSPVTPAKANENRGTTGTTSPSGLDPNTVVDFDFGLFASRSTGTSLLYLNDLVLIPIDEGSVCLEFGDNANGNGFIYDETGYFTHGSSEIWCSNWESNIITQHTAKVTGTGIQLTPGVENRIYAIAYDSSNQSIISHTVQINVNIIPRSRGIRDRINIYG